MTYTCLAHPTVSLSCESAKMQLMLVHGIRKHVCCSMPSNRLHLVVYDSTQSASVPKCMSKSSDCHPALPLIQLAAMVMWSCIWNAWATTAIFSCAIFCVVFCTFAACPGTLLLKPLWMLAMQDFEMLPLDPVTLMMKIPPIVWKRLKSE